jgi:hypothetical protein
MAMSSVVSIPRNSGNWSITYLQGLAFTNTNMSAIEKPYSQQPLGLAQINTLIAAQYRFAGQVGASLSKK